MTSTAGSCFQEVVLSASSEDDNMHLWDLRTATTLVSYRPSVTATFASQDVVGRDFIAVAQAAKPTLQLFSWRKDQPYLRCALPEKIVSLACSASGAYLLAGGSTGRLYLWEVASGAMLRTWEGHYRSITCICFTDDGTHVITASEDSLIRVWNVGMLLDYSGGHLDIPSPSTSWNEHSLPVTALAIGAGGVSARLVSASLDRTARLWHIPSGTCLASVHFRSPLTCIALHPADHFFCVGGSDGTIYSADLLSPLPSATGTPSLATASSYSGHTSAVLCLSFSWDGTALISGSRDGTARVWDAASGQTLKTFAGHRGPVTYVRAMLRPPDLLGHGAGTASAAAARGAVTPFAPLARRPELQSADAPGYAGPDRPVPVAAHPVCEAGAPANRLHLAPAAESGRGGDDVVAGRPSRVRGRDVTEEVGGAIAASGGAEVGELREEVVKWRRLAGELHRFAVDKLLAMRPDGGGAGGP